MSLHHYLDPNSTMSCSKLDVNAHNSVFLWPNFQEWYLPNINPNNKPIVFLWWDMKTKNDGLVFVDISNTQVSDDQLDLVPEADTCCVLCDEANQNTKHYPSTISNLILWGPSKKPTRSTGHTSNFIKAKVVIRLNSCWLSSSCKCFQGGDYTFGTRDFHKYTLQCQQWSPQE